MIVTFVSNYINHHQLPFCEAMVRSGKDVEFYFIQTMPMEEKRRSMGWTVEETSIPYLILSYREEKRAKELILNSDVVLFGWTEGRLMDLRDKRLSSGKLSFCVSERIYREGQWKMISPRGLLSKYREHGKYRNKPVYLLCTGAYVASDFSLIRSYPGKMLKWGYFPDVNAFEETEECSKTATTGAVAKQVNPEEEDVISMLWAGRLIDLKHPEFAIKLAGKLKEEGYRFRLDILGDGPLKDGLKDLIRKNELTDVIGFHGGKSPKEVLHFMRRADIFLFTSNYLEGWGAVVNEAMGCGCAVVASEEAGSVPFLIEDGKNGLSYKNGDYKEFEKKVKSLFEDPGLIGELGKEALETIQSVWNADSAAYELLRFCRQALEGETPEPADCGPMSTAEVIKAPGVLRTMQEKNHLE